MAPEARQRISYVLPLADTAGGHRLGINGLAVDRSQSILYSGGRDGQICAWDLDLDLHSDNEHAASARSPSSTKFIKQVQAHTHWVNDILLAQSNTALVSASSDITVKLWRPHSEQDLNPATIGVHSDYVKCLACPNQHSEWIASGGLDHKINLWDLDGHGQRLQIDAGEHDKSAKSSVYALSAKRSILASGGPESIVRLWDSRTGKRITNFVGHTDNIRDILLDEDCDTVMTASSDQSIKVWSITAGRCMYTLTMHNDSVWSLHSDHPRLSIFYSGDRSGLIAKTDVRNCEDMDQGMSIALAKEQEGISKLVAAGENIWTTTSSSRINRWRDIDIGDDVEIVESPRARAASLEAKTKPSSAQHSPDISSSVNACHSKVPLACCLQISFNAPIPGLQVKDAEASTISSANRPTGLPDAFEDLDDSMCTPLHELPEETIPGQKGLIKHVMLNDRRRVLTLDTTGEVVLWDLLKCSQIGSFGKRHLEDVKPTVDRPESVANWCSVDTQTGKLVVILEKNYCFDAEAYADELDLANSQYFRDDQRINLGKWVLRYLFSKFIDAEIERDTVYRDHLNQKAPEPGRLNRLQSPASNSLSRISSGATNDSLQDDLVSAKVNSVTPIPPSSSIISAAVQPSSGESNNHPSTADDGSMNLSEPTLQTGARRTSSDRASDHRSNNENGRSHPGSQENVPQVRGENDRESSSATSPADVKDDKGGASLFGKKFRMNFPRKLGRSSIENKPSVIDEKSEESPESSKKDEKANENSLLGTIEDMRLDYEAQLQTYPSEAVISGITPSTANDTPPLNHPSNTTVLIQEEQPNAGGAVDLYQGSIRSVGRDVDIIEKMAPRWLGELLLRNQMPEKELGKVSFVLMPYKDLLPSIANPDGNTRLTANRMLRAKKVLAYVAERIESPPAEPDPDAMKPEEYLELYCQDQVIDHNTTLATMKAIIWKTGGDVVLYYKSNGKKPEIEQLLAEKASAMSAAEATGKVGPSLNWKS